MKLTHNCPKCNKPAIIQSEFPTGNSMVCYVYRCGHMEVKTKEIKGAIISSIPIMEDNHDDKHDYIKTVDLNENKLSQAPSFKDDLEEWYARFENESGNDGILKQEVKPYVHPSFYANEGNKVCYDFQIEGVKFTEQTQLRCLIADAMGLGKTIQALISLKRNEIVAMPTLILVKGATTFQWNNEFREWVSKELGSCIAVTSRIHLIPGFKAYILSMDMIAKQDIQEKLLTLGIKSIIIDECQNFKNPNAKRTESLIKFIRNANIHYILALSGTPIKNRLGEYGVILNLLAPAYFPNSTLDYKWFKPESKLNSNGKYVTVYERLNPFRADEFRQLTSKFIIRREKHEVLKNLPDLTRDYQIIEITDQKLKNSYNHAVSLFSNWLKDNKSGIKSSELLGWLAQIRAITGQAKCINAIEWIKDFMESTDESLAVGIHHHTVRDTLYYVLEQSKLNPLKLSGEDSVYRKNDIVRAFTNGDNRLLIINALAGGIGLNLQTCANAIILERQWNSADEEQFEARFHRNGQKQAVTITYLIAKGTIDEFFHDIVQRKRKILIESGIGVNWDIGSDMETLKDLAEKVVSHKI